MVISFLYQCTQPDQVLRVHQLLTTGRQLLAALLFN